MTTRERKHIFKLPLIFLKIKLASLNQSVRPCAKQTVIPDQKTIINKRKSEQAHIPGALPYAPTLLENAVNNEWQFQKSVHLSCTK